MKKPLPWDAAEAAAWMKRERESRAWSTTDLANRARGIAMEEGSSIKLTQQSISDFEQPGKRKRVPDWLRYVRAAFDAGDDETAEDPNLDTGKSDSSVMVRLLPTHVGLGSGGTGEGDEGRISFSRDLIENDLRIPVDKLLAMVAEGNSMEPDFRGGDQILVDTRRVSLAQPGAFCLWDGDGHVVKFLQRVQGSDPQRVRVISANGVYEPEERLLDEINLVGRVVWFGRRVQ
jgi:phage repressor protein C with HTH and peptisase S24 domain